MNLQQAVVILCCAFFDAKAALQDVGDIFLPLVKQFCAHDNFSMVLHSNFLM